MLPPAAPSAEAVRPDPPILAAKPVRGSPPSADRRLPSTMIGGPRPSERDEAWSRRPAPARQERIHAEQQPAEDREDGRGTDGIERRQAGVKHRRDDGEVSRNDRGQVAQATEGHHRLPPARPPRGARFWTIRAGHM